MKSFATLFRIGIFRPSLVRLLTGDGRVRIPSLPPIPFPGPGHVETVEQKTRQPTTQRKKKKANSPVVQVVQLESPLERLSDCRTVPYLRFFLVRNEEVVGSNPISSTTLKCLCRHSHFSRLPDSRARRHLRRIWQKSGQANLGAIGRSEALRTPLREFQQISVLFDGRSIVEAYTKLRLLHDLEIRHPHALRPYPRPQSKKCK